MINCVTVQEVQQNLLDLLASLHPGEGVEIVLENQVIGRLVADGGTVRAPRQPGSAIGTLKILVEDNEHLQDFSQYMS
ncbi:antitoxin [Leptolyngbya sp. PCC 6406]|uniref:antitoxin n=1 Tax=Leptolyngbya sp. PCC 6406 TaxID=1173264 RepID=UPI0002AC1727|nr:antitoxin [Leptolyngbya sp. PCC 6406]